MRIEKVNIGEKIEERVIELGFSNAFFAQSIGKQRQNIKMTVFDKHSIDTDLLIQICEVLDFDFFQYYRNNNECNKNNYIKNAITEVKAAVKIQVGNEEKEQILNFYFGEKNL
jgi:plasmid maintenance system antidote protein VapI